MRSLISLRQMDLLARMNPSGMEQFSKNQRATVKSSSPSEIGLSTKVQRRGMEIRFRRMPKKKITGWDQGKFGIGDNGILDPLKSEFPCNRDGVRYQLQLESDCCWNRRTVWTNPFSSLLTCLKLRNKYHLEQSLIEAVIVTKECIS